MDISVQELTPVDKELTIRATREELSPKFDEAMRKLRGQIQLPGFRPGKVPLSLVKKRFGAEIEMEEINKYIQEVFETKVVPEYEPVGEAEMLDLQWENDELEVKFKIGSRPEFELLDLSGISVDKMVHDVTDEEVEEEIRRTLERHGNQEEVEGTIEEEHRVVVDVQSLNENGDPVPGDEDKDQVLNLKDENAEDFRQALVGKKKGDVVDMEVGEGDEKDRFRIHVKRVERSIPAELTDEFAKEHSRGEAANADEFRSWIKSSMQQYYDQTSEELFRQDLITALTEAHDFSIPAVFEQQLLNNYVEYLRQQMGGQLPEDFNADDYKERMKEQALEEAKWYFINLKLQEKFEDIEITPEDIDEYITVEAARYGVTVDQMKQLYAGNPSQLENLRISIRDGKVLEKVQNEVNVVELSKEEFRKNRGNKEETE